MDPKMGAQTWSFLIIWLLFPCQTALGAQMAPKPPPRAPRASPSLDFHQFFVDFGRFLDDFLHHVGYFLSGLRVGGIGRQASTIAVFPKPVAN